LGYTLDALGSYFAIRLLVRTPQQVLGVWKQLAWIVLILSPFMLYEWITRQNAFGILTYDGFEIAVVRNGKVRAAGPLSHPILTGTFGAILIFRGANKHRRLMGAACIAATMVTFSSGSSGPLMAWVAGFFGWGMWRFRRHMRTILWSLFAMGVVIHVVREKPIWHLILRLSALTGGTGYHRYELIDAFVNRFSEWALLGTDSTAHWGWGLQDTTNQYVVEGVNGGLLTLVLFILVLRTSFVQLKRARLVFERFQGPKSLWAQLAWGSSVSLMVHCVSFVSVSYFGQILQFFFFFIATIPAMSRYKRRKRAKTPARPSPVHASSTPPQVATG
jgi:hypothetical protein